MHNRFIRNISTNTLQLGINQVFGVVIFYALSKGIDKDTFGQINWCLAVLLTSFGVLTLGIDQLMVKKIASGENRQQVFSSYFFHVIITGVLFYGFLLLAYFIWPHLFSGQTLLIFIAVGKLCIFFSTPFKQLSSGLEKFTSLFYMTIVSNLIRATGLLLCLLSNSMNIKWIIIIFIMGDVLELLMCILIARPMLIPLRNMRWNRGTHFLLIKDALPQAGVVVFSTIMSRLDWILIGALISRVKLAEYSFAWKMFEVSTLPLLIIAPIMIPLFARLLKKTGNNPDPYFLLEWQIIIASFVALLLNICWVPVIDLITDGKYGAVNSNTIFILSLSMPLLYLNNYLWTINFAMDKLKLIFFIMGIAFLVNILGCFILIPNYKNEGGAVAYCLTILFQVILYLKVTSFSMPVKRRYGLLVWPATATITGYLVQHYSIHIAVALIIAVILYGAIVIFSKRIRLADWKTLEGFY